MDSSFEFAAIAVGGVSLVWLIPRIVQALKTWGLSGTKPITAVVFALGGILSGLAGAINEGLIPPVALPWIRVGLWVLGGGAAAVGAVGEYELQKLRR